MKTYCGTTTERMTFSDGTSTFNKCGEKDWQCESCFIYDLASLCHQLQYALNLHMSWIGRPPRDNQSFDSLREDAWVFGIKAIDQYATIFNEKAVKRFCK